MTIYKNGGLYQAFIQKWGFTEAKTGTPQLFFSVSISKEIDSKELKDCPQYERTIFRAITENTIGFVSADLKNLGYPHPTFDQLEPDHPQAYSFEGHEVKVRCKHGVDQKGAPREEWSFAFGGSFEGKPVEKSKVSKLNALFGSYLKANATALATAPKPVMAGSNSNEGEVI